MKMRQCPQNENHNTRTCCMTSHGYIYFSILIAKRKKQRHVIDIYSIYDTGLCLIYFKTLKKQKKVSNLNKAQNAFHLCDSTEDWV